MKLIIILRDSEVECFEYSSKELFLLNLEELAKDYIQNVDEISKKIRGCLCTKSSSDGSLNVEKYLNEVLYPYSLLSSGRHFVFPVTECIHINQNLTENSERYFYEAPVVLTADEWFVEMMEAYDKRFTDLTSKKDDPQ